MVFKLKTSKETMLIFSEMNASLHLQPFVLVKLAIALSIRRNEVMLEGDFKTDSDGLELNRQTITAEYDDLFKALICDNEGKLIPESEYFPKYLKAYIDKGAKLLYSEFRYSGSKFYDHMVMMEKGI